MPLSAHSTVIDLVLSAGIVVKAVLLILLGFSVFSWAVIFFKVRQFRAAERASQRFLTEFAGASRLQDIRRTAERIPQAPLAVLVQEGMARIRPPREGEMEGGADSRDSLAGVERSLRFTLQDELTHYETYLGFLATTGNVTPFIGLFGTVWGILNAFHQIGIQGNASIAAVAPGIAEALVATAAGLATAIPAVTAYNYFIQKIRKMASRMEVFSGEFLDFIENETFRTGRESRRVAGVSGESGARHP